MRKIIVLMFVLLLFTLSVKSDEYERIYFKQCATCHGNKGNGQGRAGASLSPAPTSFISVESRARLSLEKIKIAIRDGISGTAMSAYGRRFDEENINGLAEYVQQQFMGVKIENESEDVGQSIYAQHCSACHGDKGGTAVWARNALNPAPRDFTSALAKAELSRERMLKSVMEGRAGTAMMSFEKRLTKGQIQRVVDFIRSTFMGVKNEPIESSVDLDLPFMGGLIGDADEGRKIFQQNCFACHGKKGDGKGPRAHFNVPRPRDFTSPESRRILNRLRLHRGIARGKPRTVMPAWSTVLSEQQIVDVAEYVFQTFVIASAKKKIANKQRKFKLGQAIYNYRCYFCHGYSGDAKTLASTYLTPSPVAFTELATKDLTVEYMQEVVREGKKNTAMMSFSSLLSEQDIESVVVFVREAFMSQKLKNTQYHTEENGWINHEQYQVAFPFALGEIALDIPWEELTSAQKEGKRLYLSACVSCHDRAKMDDEGVIWQSYPISWPRNAYSHRQPGKPDAMSQASPYGLHEVKASYTPETDLEKRGQDIFHANCAFCHAADGSGRHWIGQFLDPPARNFVERPVQKTYENKRELEERIKSGVSGSAMPAWRYVLSDEEIESVASFMWLRFK